MEMINNTDMFAVGEYFPPTSHYERIKRYEDNRKIFEGHHHEVFSKNITNERAKSLLYISLNFASLICKKSADFLFGEDMKILASNGEDTNEQKAFTKFYEDNDLNIELYTSALCNAYCGDSFIKVRYGQEYGGELPPEVDEPKIIIENVDPSTVFPEVLQWNKNKINKYNIAVPYYNEEECCWFLAVETHRAGYITYRNFMVTPIMWDRDNNPNQFTITAEVGEPVEVATGVNMPLVVHIPNFNIIGSWEGKDDITELHPILDEINNRVTQIASILDKHSDPAIAVPSGILESDENGNAMFNIALNKVFEVMGKEDVIPQYVTWDGQLQNAFTELDKLINTALSIAEIPPVALGMADTGTSGSSGLAIKWRMNSLLSKINRKKQYYRKGIKQVMYLSQALEEAIGIADYEITIPALVFQDGLPKDEMNETNIMNIRTGGEKTISQKTAIMILNGFTEEQADKEIERIKAEEKEASLVADPSMFGEEPNTVDIDKADSLSTEEIPMNFDMKE